VIVNATGSVALSVLFCYRWFVRKRPFLTLVLFCWSTLAAAGKNTMMPGLKHLVGA
jgi:hypothetical protein